MKNTIIVLIALFGFAGVAFAIPHYTQTQGLIPGLTNTYYIGTSTPSTLEYKGIFVKDITISGTCTGCPAGSGGGLGWASTTVPNSNSIYSLQSENVGIGTSSPYALLSVDGNSAGLDTNTRPVSIKAQSGILQNIFEILSNTGTVYFSVNRFGNTAFGNGINGTGGAGACPGCGVFLSTAAAANNGFVHKNALNQTGDAFRAIGVDNTSLFTVTPLGKLIVGTSSTPSWLAVQAAGATAFGNLSPLFDVASTTSSAYATSSLFRINADGNIGVSTTSPYKLLSVGGDAVIGASTAGGTLGDLYLPKLGTPAGTVIAVDATGKVIATTTSTGGVTSVTGAFPITSSGGATPSIGFVGLSTSTAAVLGNIPYFSGVNTFANVATGTISATSPLTVTAGRSAIGGDATFAIAANGIGNTQLEFDTGQELTTGSSPTFSFLSATALSLTTDLTVGNGGTGASTLTGLLQGNGTIAISGVTGTAGQFPYYSATNELLATSTLFLSTAGNVGIATTSPYKLFSIGGDAVVGASTAGGTIGDLYLPKLGTPAGTVIAVDPDGKVIATTTSAGGVTSVTGTYPVVSSGGATPAISLAFGTTTANTWSALQTTSNATTSLLTVSGSTWLTGITSAIPLTDSTGLISEYTGTSCTNQFVRSLSALGVATCATIVATDVDLADLTATNSSLTFSGTYDGQTARTIGLNLANVNTWTGKQTFGDLQSTNATTTALHIGNLTAGRVPYVGTAGILRDSSSFLWDNTLGKLTITNASTTNLTVNGVNVFGDFDKPTIHASSTLAYDGSYGAAGTTTYLMWNPSRAGTLTKVYCKTDVAASTAYYEVAIGSASSTVKCTTSGAENTTSISFSARDNVYEAIGTQSGNPSRIVVTPTFSY